MKKQSPVAVTAPAAAAAEGEHGEARARRRGQGRGRARRGPRRRAGPMVKLENFVIQLKAVDAERYVRVAFDLELGRRPTRTSSRRGSRRSATRSSPTSRTAPSTSCAAVTAWITSSRACSSGWTGSSRPPHQGHLHHRLHRPVTGAPMSSPLDNNEVEALMQAIQEGRVSPEPGEAGRRAGRCCPTTSPARTASSAARCRRSTRSTTRSRRCSARTWPAAPASTCGCRPPRRRCLKFADVGSLLNAPGTVGVMTLGAGHGLALLVLEGELGHSLLSGRAGRSQGPLGAGRRRRTRRADQPREDGP
jgi:hypothetical protein